MAPPKWRISLRPRQRLIFHKSARAEGRRVRAEDAPIEVELPEWRDDHVARVDALGADDAGGEGLTDGGGGVVEAEGLVPDGVEVGAGGEENIHVDRTGGGAGGVGFGSEGGEESGIVQEVREDPEGDFVGVVVDAGDS